MAVAILFLMVIGMLFIGVPAAASLATCSSFGKGPQCNRRYRQVSASAPFASGSWACAFMPQRVPAGTLENEPESALFGRAFWT